MRILIAEDEFTSHRILRAVLTKWNYDVVSAHDGSEAWEKLQREDAPKLAVLDWMMPKMDGLEVCYKLRQMEKTIPTYIILLTARDSKKDIVKGFEAGADDYIAKPFDNNELRARINAGRRIVELQASLVEKDKLQGVIEMAGAVNHELNQPMQVISGLSELLLDSLDDNHIKEDLKEIKAQVKSMGEITRKLTRITRYKTKSYLTSKIIDLDSAAE